MAIGKSVFAAGAVRPNGKGAMFGPAFCLVLATGARSSGASSASRPIPDETGPAVATDRICLLFSAGMGEIEGEDTCVIRVGSTWPIFDIARRSVCSLSLVAMLWGEPPSADTRRLPYVGDRAGAGRCDRRR